MAETVYYTFSTIAQVVATLAALLGVFTIFHMQIINKKLGGLSQNYYDTLKSHKKINPVNVPDYILGEFKKNQLSRNHLLNLEIMKDWDNKWNDKFSHLQPIFKAFSGSIDQRGKQIILTVKITILSVILIIASITVISFADSIYCTLFWV
jgi:hypothetical protein